VTADAARRLALHREEVLGCRACPNMIGPVVAGPPVVSPVLLVGQAPGPREGALGRPFAWTAGKRLFSWLETVGMDEQHVRERVYMAAVCRCFPGKKMVRGKAGGDREPSPEEIAACAKWLDREIAINRPRLVLPVGKMAIAALIGERPLVDAVGRSFRGERAGVSFDAVPLPHPSGASTWYHRDPGKGLTEAALRTIARHEAWRAVRDLG
jgi:uracil-DNA glycosylase